MLISTVLFVAMQLISVCLSTHVPLEVYELTTNNNNNDNNPASVTVTDPKHKIFEYSTINLPAAVTTSSSSSSSNTPDYSKAHAKTTIDDNFHVDFEMLSTQQTQLPNQLDRRRSKQIADILKTHRDLTKNPNKYHTQQVPTTTTITTVSTTKPTTLSSDNNSTHHNGKEIHIFYQYGDSEADLPTCLPNEVCSTVSLYDEPWIERQCRCPNTKRKPEVIIHHHHHHKESTHSHNNHNSEKYHSYHHKNKNLIFEAFGFGADNKYDDLHLKKLMHKLGAVYEDDINLPTDYASNDQNSALASNEESDVLTFSDEINDNDLPHLAMKRQQYLFKNSAHMRHSGHMGHQKKMTGGCPSGLAMDDGHTIVDKTRLYKLCRPVNRLPICKYFTDTTWTLSTWDNGNTTEQIMHCRCRKNSVAYLAKREAIPDSDTGVRYMFVCSPLTRLRCQRKDPCRLFSVRKRKEGVEEVRVNTLCSCPKAHHCPNHHTQSGVLAGATYMNDSIQIYTGYCMAND